MTQQLASRPGTSVSVEATSRQIRGGKTNIQEISFPLSSVSPANHQSSIAQQSSIALSSWRLGWPKSAKEMYGFIQHVQN
jgi:hypothetical protein